MSKPVIGPNNKRTRIDITLPVDAAGNWAFDENGDPVKGRTPVEFSLPRFDFMPGHKFREMMAEVEKHSEPVDGETPAQAHERGILAILATLKPFVNDDVFKLIEDMPMGVLEQISSDWNEGSSIPLGELRASTRSSKNTKGRSDTTSSDTDSD